jgi:hypothetical protein
MARARPVILYLKKTLTSENNAIRLLMALPQGERTKFLRQVIVLGRDAVRMDEARAQVARKATEAPLISSGEQPPVEENHDA